MDEIAALSTYERDDLHRGIRAAMKCEPFDEHEATYWKLGHIFYRSCHEQDSRANATLN